MCCIFWTPEYSISSPHTLGLGLRFDCVQLHVPYTNKLKLDGIQSKALRIILCGAFCSTSIAAMQVECSEMPLEIRRTQQELNFAIKLKATARHPVKSILERNRLSLSHKFTENSRPKPVYQKVKDFLDITKMSTRWRRRG